MIFGTFALLGALTVRRSLCPQKPLLFPFTALVNFFRILKGLAALVKVKGRPLAAKNIVKTRLFLKILKT